MFRRLDKAFERSVDRQLQGFSASRELSFAKVLRFRVGVKTLKPNGLRFRVYSRV